MLIEYGFTVVRLYVAWPGVEPSKASYNTTYLDTLYKIVDQLGQSGIYTILDCHQDLLSPKFCGILMSQRVCLLYSFFCFFFHTGEGVPDYAALYMNRTIKPLPFPEPFPSLTPYKLDPNTGYMTLCMQLNSHVLICNTIFYRYPSRNECSKHAFFTYYLSDAVGKSW